MLVLTEKITKMSWPVGIITDVFMGRDALVRTVEIKMPLRSGDIDTKGRPKTQYKVLRRGIEPITLLE